jgi:tetratricopeptide (TPR) repeat protein
MIQLEISLEFKAKANEEFKIGNYENAIRMYSEAISYCPPEEKKDIAILHNNSGLCYIKLVSTSLSF